MKVELDTIQLVGVWLLMSGMVLQSTIFLTAYLKIGNSLTPDDDKKKDDDKGFKIIKFIGNIRKVIKLVTSEEKQEQVKRILSIVDWIIISAFGLVIAGFALILIGTLL